MDNKFIEEITLKCESLGLKVIEKAKLSSSGHVSPPELMMITPFIYKGKKIKWIDAVYMIGSRSTHRLMKYRIEDLVERYGSGLFIYWLDYSQKVYNDYSEHVVVRTNFSIDASEIKVLDAIDFPYNPNPEVVADTACDPSHKESGKMADADDGSLSQQKDLNDQPSCSSRASQCQPTSSNNSGVDYLPRDIALARLLFPNLIDNFCHECAKKEQKVNNAFKQRRRSTSDLPPEQK